ncbi:polyphenol oxidase family protein [Leptospira sp. WS92.C1]
MGIFHTFPLSSGAKIRILIAGKKELPSISLDPDTQKFEISKLTGISKSAVHILNQVHGDAIFNSETSESFSFPEADALIGESSGKILCIKTADCMPLFFWSTESSKFVAVHSGWKGTLAGISEKALGQTFSVSILKNGSLRVYLGPCASGKRYEIGEDVASLFRSEFPSCLRSVSEEKSLLDLESFVKYRLEKNGIVFQFESSGICTMGENSDFFSHRKKETGRNLNLIWKED